MIELLPEEIPPVTSPEEQRIVNCYHRLCRGADWETIKRDLIRKFGMNKPAFLRNGSGNYSNTEAAIRDGNYSVLLHISTRLAQPSVGDANVKAELIVKKK